MASDQTAKADAGKLQISMVPTQIVKDIAEVRMYGNRKYKDPDNWKTVEVRRYIDALLRHTLEFVRDLHSKDDESGIEHYKHNAMGENDVSYQQLETVFTLARLRWDWNNDMSNKYPRAVIGSDDDQYGPGVPVITPTTGKAEIISKYEDWVKAGFCKNLALFRDNVVCIQDPDDEHALQWYVPADLVKQFFIGKTQFAFS